MKNILFIAGEVSADYYGSLLADNCKKINPKLKLFAVGGENLKKTVDNFIFDATGKHHIGFNVNAKKKLFNNLFNELTFFLNHTKIDKVIIIDFGFYNFELANFLKQYNLSIITFITPNFWLWKDYKKAKKLAEYSKKIITIFPKEFEFYQQFSDQVYYFGHPFSSEFKGRSPNISSHGLLRRSLNAAPAGETGVKGDEIPFNILFLPGSREFELKKLLPIMLKTAREIHKTNPLIKFQFLTPKPEWLRKITDMIKIKNIPNCNIYTIKQKTQIYENADLVISASGTANLETVYYNKPQIVFGKLSYFSYFIVKYILRLPIKYISLPNLLLDKAVVPEFIQRELKPKKIAKKALELINQDQTPLLKDYEEIRTMLKKDPDPILGAAKIILT